MPLDKETTEFLYRVAPSEVWEEAYCLGSFNLVKVSAETNLNAIEEAGLKNVLKYTLRAFKASQMHSLQAFLRLTGMVWKLDGDMTWGVTASAATNRTEIAVNTDRQQL